jgi:peptidyl-prolyl cis-trans isomerase SurA
VDSIVKAGNKTKEEVMEQVATDMSAKDNEMKYLIQEYHDGLLLYEISNQLVWDKAAKDEAGLAQYFKKNKKKYAWDKPRYKGMAFHVKEPADVKAVKDCVKKLPFDQWAEKLRTTFNADSVIRIRVEKGIFKEGDNALVDSLVFKKDTTVNHLKDYPIDDVYGKLLKKGPEDYTDVRGLVVADYQEMLEQQWVAELRRKYTFTVNEEVLQTVNKH